MTTTISVPSSLLSDLEQPAGGIPILIDFAASSVFAPATPDSVIIGDYALLQTESISVTYGYTPPVGSTAPSPVPEPGTTALMAGSIPLVVFGAIRKANAIRVSFSC